ncbi:hypothetical protein BMMON2_49850 [Burkholderia mallei]
MRGARRSALGPKRPVTTLTDRSLDCNSGLNYTGDKRVGCRVYPAPTARHRIQGPFTRLLEGSTVKLTFAISAVALVLIAGTTTICLSGAVTERTTEYGGARATFDQLFSSHSKICR